MERNGMGNSADGTQRQFENTPGSRQSRPRRFEGIEGVEYPAPLPVRTRRGLDPNTRMPYPAPPPGSISTEEAAQMLGCTQRNALRRLHSHCRRCYLVRIKCALAYYWPRSLIEDEVRCKKLLANKENTMPEYVTPNQVIILLNISNTTLRRLVERGHLRRVPDPDPPRGEARRERILYSFRDVMTLALRMRNMQRVVTWYRTVSREIFVRDSGDDLAERLESEDDIWSPRRTRR